MDDILIFKLICKYHRHTENVMYLTNSFAISNPEEANTAEGATLQPRALHTISFHAPARVPKNEPAILTKGKPNSNNVIYHFSDKP